MNHPSIYALAQRLAALATTSGSRISIAYARDGIRVVVTIKQTKVYDRRGDDYAGIIAGAIRVVNEIDNGEGRAA